MHYTIPELRALTKPIHSFGQLETVNIVLHNELKSYREKKRIFISQPINEKLASQCNNVKQSLIFTPNPSVPVN